MKDLAFDITTREVILKNGDFTTTADPSEQNGGIMLLGKGMNVRFPIFGVGLVPAVINGNLKNLVFQLNRWQQQCYQDGAQIARWTMQPVAGQASIITKINYPQ